MESLRHVLIVVLWAVLALFWVYIAVRLAVKAGARSWWECWKRWRKDKEGDI